MERRKEGVVGILIHKNEVLLGKKVIRKNSVLSEKWHLPRETLEGNESDVEGLVRGYWEEVKNSITEKRILIRVNSYIASNKSLKERKLRWYECNLWNSEDYGNVVADSDLQDVRWVNVKDVFNYVPEEIVNLWPQEVKNYFLEKQQDKGY